MGDQEVIDIQASQGVSVSIVDGRREEVSKLSISLHVALPTLRLRSTRALGRAGDAHNPYYIKYLILSLYVKYLILSLYVNKKKKSYVNILNIRFF